ncbi:MAG TPA: LamG domain-containing protein [Candidatus Pacearchaeota archaeon]|nr:LamG domain-containing protein [Candidatus Pacearchaeota archaeon]HOC53953.1 LamG domain-containing protein [Candidatus Pacearchaeota archaeon]
MRKSFTLVEILVVIVVIGILSAFILVGMSSITESANITKSKAFANSLRNSLLNSLISEWKLDGNTNDSWGNATCSLNGTTTVDTCVYGSCFNFDGSDDYINCGTNSSLAPTDYITVSFWVNFNSIANMQYIVSRGRDSYGSGYNVLKYSNSNFAFEVNLDNVDDNPEIDISGTTFIAANKWYNVVATYDYSSGARLYVNGKKENSSSLTGSIVYRAGQGDNFLIGVMSHSFPQYFDTDAKIDDIKFFNGIMPATAIINNYYIGLIKLYKNNGISSIEFNRRTVDLKNNLFNN